MLTFPIHLNFYPKTNHKVNIKTPLIIYKMIRPEFTQDLNKCYASNGKKKLYTDQFNALMKRLKNEYEYLNKEKLRCNFDFKNPHSIDQIKKIEHDIKCNRAEMSLLFQHSVRVFYLC